MMLLLALSWPSLCLLKFTFHNKTNPASMKSLHCLKVANRILPNSLISFHVKFIALCQSRGHYSQNSPMNVFDRRTKKLQKERAARLDDHTVYDYLKEEVGWRTSDRMYDIKRYFNNVLDLGCGKGFVGRHLLRETVGTLHQTEFARGMLERSVLSEDVPTSSVLVDEEFIPFRSNIFDLVVSSLSLHWVNNLPGAISQVHRVLANDGCFLGTMFGGDTLHELRVSLYLAELERKGGYSARISPYTSAQDLGNLLNGAGFVMLTIDVDDITINYPSIIELMQDLKGMGESNCSWNRCHSLPRETLLAAAAIYQEKYGSENSKDDSGNDIGPSIPALFQIINFIAWKPDKSQLQPAKRGSGEVSMKDLGNLDALAKQIGKLRKDKGLDPKMARSVEEIEKSAKKLFESKDDDKKDS